MKKYIILVAILVIAAVATFMLQPKTEAPQPAVTEYKDLIRVTSPAPDGEVSSTTPLVVTGEARGNWYFEATFPITITNWDGLIIGEGYAQAEGEWMTTDYVPFKGTINFTTPDYGTRGTVIFHKSNPSGDFKRDDAVEVTIKFI